jgi:hypothetical protein
MAAGGSAEKYSRLDVLRLKADANVGGRSTATVQYQA